MEPWTLIDKLAFKLMRFLADKSVDFFVRLKITHNQVTFWGSMVFLPLSALSFAQGNYVWVLLGIFFAFCHSLFDFVDGTLGRKTNTLNKLGAWSDPIFDLIGSGLLMMGIAIGVLRTQNDLFWLSVTLIAMFGHYAVLVIAYQYEGKIYGKNGPEILESFRKSRTTVFDFVIKEFIFLRSFIFMFLGTMRYSLIVFGLFNQLPYFIFVYAVFSNIRWMIMFFAYAQVLNKPGTNIPQVNLKIIEIMRRFIPYN